MTVTTTKGPKPQTNSEPISAQASPVLHVHRIGTVTLGILLIFFGLLFLLHTAGFALSYTTIFHLWPVIFISLGCEILAAQFLCKKENQMIHLVYDKAAIVLLFLLTVFAISMAVMDSLFEYLPPLYEEYLLSANR